MYTELFGIKLSKIKNPSLGMLLGEYNHDSYYPGWIRTNPSLNCTEEYHTNFYSVCFIDGHCKSIDYVDVFNNCAGFPWDIEGL
jgi:hypothetical protein